MLIAFYWQTRVTAADSINDGDGYHVCNLHLVISLYRIDCDKPPKHILEPTVISSPHSQEFMVSRIFSVVLILLRPLMDEFTL